MTDPAERAQAWADVNKMIMEQAPSIPYMWDYQAVAASPNVRGVQNGYSTTWDLELHLHQVGLRPRTTGRPARRLARRAGRRLTPIADTRMARYIIRRLLGMVLLLILVSAVTFIIFNVFPSTDPAALRAGRQPTPEIIESIRSDLGLDRPLIVQFGDYIWDVFAHQDFGRSYVSNVDVLDQIRTNLPATISLAIGGVIVWLTFGLSIGIISAVRHRSVFDRLAIGLSLIAISAPVYWLGLVALYLFAPDFGVFGIGVPRRAGLLRAVLGGPGQVVRSRSILPWFVLATTFAAVYARLLRGSLLEVLNEDYIRTARAKGLSERHGDPQARRALGDHARRHRARPRHRHPARRCHPDRVRLQHPRHRPARLRRDRRAATCRSCRGPCCSGPSSSSS